MSTSIQCLAATTMMETLLQHNDPEYEALRAHIQNTNKPTKNGITTPYDDLSVADNGLILLDWQGCYDTT